MIEIVDLRNRLFSLYHRLYDLKWNFDLQKDLRDTVRRLFQLATFDVLLYDVGPRNSEQKRSDGNSDIEIHR